MAFGDYLKEDGWIIITLSPGKAIKFSSFGLNSNMARWLNDTVRDDEWQRVSFRRVAFRNMSTAILFKLTF